MVHFIVNMYHFHEIERGTPTMAKDIRRPKAWMGRSSIVADTWNLSRHVGYWWLSYSDLLMNIKWESWMDTDGLRYIHIHNIIYIYTYIYMFIYLFIYLSIYLFIYLQYLFIYLSIYLSIYTYIYIYTYN